jgi:TetR/AcrR family tetracycline transcriptional repressor
MNRQRERTMPLERETVVQVALELLDEVGLDGLTMRRLAERLGVQNPALYWHFKNKQDLLNQMATMMVGELFAAYPMSDAVHDWSEWLAGAARIYRRALLSRRDGARLIATADLTTSNWLAGFELMVRVLREAGFSAREAVVGPLTVFDYTLGTTFEEQAEPPHVQAERSHGDPDALRALIDPDTMPMLYSSLQEAGLVPSEDRTSGFEAGLDLILRGLAALRSSTPPPSTDAQKQ